MVKHKHICSTFSGWLCADSYCLLCQVVWSLRRCSDRVVRECDVKSQGPDDVAEVSSWRWRTDYWRTGLRVGGWGWWGWGRRALASRRGRQYDSSGPSLSLVTHAAAAASTAPALSAPDPVARIISIYWDTHIALTLEKRIPQSSKTKMSKTYPLTTASR